MYNAIVDCTFISIIFNTLVFFEMNSDSASLVLRYFLWRHDTVDAAAVRIHLDHLRVLELVIIQCQILLPLATSFDLLSKSNLQHYKPFVSLDMGTNEGQLIRVSLEIGFKRVMIGSCKRRESICSQYSVQQSRMTT
jgi:hypothetical protein